MDLLVDQKKKTLLFLAQTAHTNRRVQVPGTQLRFSDTRVRINKQRFAQNVNAPSETMLVENASFPEV